MGDVSDHSKAMRGRKSCRGKGVAKEKKVPRRGMGVARLERMRLLEQKGTFFMMEDGEDIIIEKTARTTTTAPLLSCFVPLPYLLQRFPDQVGVEREALELAWNRGIGQWHFLESSIVTTTPSSLLLAPTNMDRIHTIPRDFSYTSTSTDGNNIINLGYTAPSFAATTKLQGNRIQTSDWSDTCLDLSLSTAHHISQERRNLFQENQEARGGAAGMPRAGFGSELWETEAEKRGGCRCRCSSCTRASEFHYGGESESSFTSQPSSRPSPSLQLTLGLPS